MIGDQLDYSNDGWMDAQNWGHWYADEADNSSNESSDYSDYYESRYISNSYGGPVRYSQPEVKKESEEKKVEFDPKKSPLFRTINWLFSFNAKEYEEEGTVLFHTEK